MHEIDARGCYSGMLQRCLNPNNINYKNYGGRGIKVCDRWLESFSNFIDDVGPRPSEAHSLERLKVNGDYCPENVIWATKSKQANNTTRTVYLSYGGVVKTLSEWSILVGICQGTLNNRIRNLNWDVEDALTKPVRSKRPDFSWRQSA